MPTWPATPARAARIYAEVGSRPDEAYARLQAGRTLFASGQAAQATSELDTALAFYRQVAASAYLTEAASFQ